jgi:Uma2 family endonuclease
MTQAAIDLAGGVVPVRAGVWVEPGRWTADRALTELPETTEMIIEVFDGSLVVSPRPAKRHQVVLRELGYLLHRAARPAGFEALPEINLKLGDDLADPDITVVRHQPGNRVWFDAAEAVLLVEIMSPDQTRLELVNRPRKYAKSKIPYYLRVEFDGDSPVMKLYRLTGAQYQLVVEGKAGATFAMREPFEFEVDPGDLLDD